MLIQDTPPKYNASAVKILMQLLPKQWYDKYLEACEHLDLLTGFFKSKLD